MSAPMSPPARSADTPSDTPSGTPTNGARALSRAGTLAGVFVVLAGAAAGSGTGESWRADVGWTLLFATAGIVLMAGGAWVLDRSFLGREKSRSMSVELDNGNLAAGIVAAAHKLSAGIVTGRCLYGADVTTLAVGAAFVGLGLATLVIFEVLHRQLTHYADEQEVRGGNSAVALSAAGLSLALAVIVAHAADGHFAGWAESLRAYFVALVLAVALYPVRQVLVKRIILGLPLSLRGPTLDRALAEDRNCSLGAVEALTYVATALLVTRLS